MNRPKNEAGEYIMTDQQLRNECSIDAEDMYDQHDERED